MTTGPNAPRIIRDLVLLLVGALLGGGVATGVFLVADDDTPSTAGGPVQEPTGDGEDATEPTEPAIDPTDTEFGELTEGAEESGVRVQWASELLTGDGGEAEFVTAHRDGTVAFIHDDTRIVDTGSEIHLCTADGCQVVGADDARGRLPSHVVPYFEVTRTVAESTASPDYRITGETELESGIFEQCGEYDPVAFDLAMPEEVVSVSQCVDATRNVPLRIGLQGEDRSLGGAALTALADAQEDDFGTG